MDVRYATDGGTEQEFAGRVPKQEHQLYPHALRLIAKGGSGCAMAAPFSTSAPAPSAPPPRRWRRISAPNLEDLARFTP